MFSHDFLPHCVLSLHLHWSRIKWPLIQRLHFLLLLPHIHNIHLQGFIVLNKVHLLVKPNYVKQQQKTLKARKILSVLYYIFKAGFGPQSLHKEAYK